MAAGKKHGTQLVTASGLVLKSGTPITVYGIDIISGAGGGSVVTLRNGTTAAATIYIQETGTTSTGVHFNYGEGFYFPNGLYVSVDANIVSALISVDQL